MKRLIRLEDGREVRVTDEEYTQLALRIETDKVDIKVAAEYNGKFYVICPTRTMLWYMDELTLAGPANYYYLKAVRAEPAMLNEFKVGNVLLVENGERHNAYLVVDTSGGRVSCQYFSDGYVKYCSFTDEIKKYYKAVKAEDEEE